MERKDKYGIFKYARELIEAHMKYEGSKTSSFGYAAELPPACDDCKNPGNDIKNNYKQEVEKKMIEFIGNVSKPLKNAYDIVHLFRDSCYGFAMVGMRFDMLYERVAGRPKEAEDVLLSCAIRRDLNFGTCRINGSDDELLQDIFMALPGEIIDGPLDKIDQLVCAGFNGGKSFDDDATSLLAVYLLRHLHRANSKMDLSRLACAFNLVSCAHCIVGTQWKERSLIGYFDSDKPCEFGNKFINAPNLEFVRIFTDKLDTLFLSGASDDYATMRLRRILCDLTATAYFNSSNDALHAFQAVSDVMDMIGRNETITKEHVNGCDYRSNIYRSIVLPKNDVASGQEYAINREGLIQFAELVDALGLADEMPGFKSIAARIHAL